MNQIKPREFLTPDNYAAIYARKSIKTENHSIESQITRGKEVLNEKGLILYNTYFDSESASRFPYSKRKGFVELLRDLENGKFKTVITFKRDRLSRRFYELLEVKKKFREHGVKVIYSAPGEFQASTQDCYTDFIENIIMGISEMEAKMQKTRTSTGIKIKKEKGEYSLSGKIPFGFTINAEEYLEENSSDIEYSNVFDMYPHKEKSIIVKKIFKTYLENDFKTMDDFVNSVNSINHTNETLNKGRVEYMIRNPAYAGIKRPDEGSKLFYKNSNNKLYKINEAIIEPLTNVKGFIDKDTWIKANLKYLNSKRQYAKRIQNYLFKNLLKCSVCKKKITISGNYYACRTKKCTRISKKILIPSLLKRILQDILIEENINHIVEIRKKKLSNIIDSLNRRLKKTIAEKEGSLLNFIYDPKDDISSKDLKNLIDDEKKLIKKISSYEDKLIRMDDIFTNIDMIKQLGTRDDIVDFLENELNVDDVQSMIHSFIGKVYICGSNRKCDVKKISYGK